MPIESIWYYINPFAVIFLAACMRTLLGWLRSGEKFKAIPFARTLIIAFLSAIVLVRGDIFSMEYLALFSAVLNVNYVVDDIRKIKNE